MKITSIKPDKFLRPTHRKQEIAFDLLTNFKQKLDTFLANIHEPSREGKQETDLRDFLNDALYRGKFYINKKETIDWAIHNGMDAKSKVAVLIEVKKTAEKTDMFSQEKPNVKALHELVLYYLRERIEHHNHEIRYLIATNCHEWYIFNELWFNENIFTTKFKKTYQDWKLSGHGTDDFYKLHAKSYLETLEKPIEFCQVDIRDYVKSSDKKLSELYKILSPEHLLKQEIANDANKLNKPFYNELLYLIGIEERKDDKSNKKIIERLLPAHRKEGSLLENTIEQLDTKNALLKVPNLESYGDTEEEQKYSVALELCITWLNRLLFLKLLEGQLIKYHHGDRKYRFLTSDRINDFDELGELFFGVLAKRPTERKQSVQQKFGDIPYLNSSLFEETTLENSVLSVEILKDRLELPLFGNTVLKDTQGKARKGEVKTLKYLLDFLDSYDFGSKDEKEVAAAKNTEAVNHDRTINAAVLGLIFEKLNGYKDGSFFTPSFITMYMCRETLRRAVVQKFNESQSVQCQDFVELKEYLDDDYKKPEKRKAYNDLLNSIRICDPAVGSGHFLVSALNEMIAIKAELKILQHPNGTRLKGYEISVENDELIVWEEDTQKDFQYKIGQAGKPFQELQMVQETLFHEKRTIIENCLFGVDINPKSVSICQLRLWIELLKNAFYTPESNYLYLETLPNIDINIKTGNSLVSRFGLDADLSKVLRSIKYTVTQYRGFVNDYKNAENKEQKRGLQKIIDNIKSNFRTEIAKYSNPKIVQLQKLKEELYVRFEGNALFGTQLNAKQKTERDILSQKIETISSEIKDSIDSPIFRNAFEWRFEFPEVLDDAGNFMGFDMVIGNPPYIKGSEFSELKNYLQNSFPNTFSSSADMYVYFVERGIQVLKPKGFVGYIIPNKWMRAGYGENIRILLKKQKLNGIIDFGDLPVFEEATAYPCILTFEKKQGNGELIATNVQTLDYPQGIESYIFQNSFLASIADFTDKDGWILSDSTKQGLIQKIQRMGLPLREYVNNKIYRGLLTGLNEAFVIDFETQQKLISADPYCVDILKPFLSGRDVKRFELPEIKQFLIFFPKGFTNKNCGEIEPKTWIKLNYPAIYEHLIIHQEKAILRGDKGDYWWELRACDYYQEFDKEKIIIPSIIKRPECIIDSRKFYSNDKTSIIGTGSKYVLSVLNSRITHYLMQQIASTKQGGFLEYKPVYISQIPIPQITAEAEVPFIEKVNQILTLKKEDPKADTSELEAEIDRMVYDLYELTEEEVLIVEGKS